MRPAPWTHLDRHRVRQFGAHSPPGARFGLFEIPHPPTAVTLRVIASIGDGWEHVSISTRRRTPNWAEMEFACRLFWGEDECVMQLHPPRADWVSNHPFCLHLWRPIEVEIPRPPQEHVGRPAYGETTGEDPADRARMWKAFLAENA